MSQSGQDIPWPFAGRILRALGDELLPCAWRCQRTRDGLAFDPIHPLLGLRGLPAAARELMADYRVKGAGVPEESPRLLGVGTPARLSARPGMLLSDHLLLTTPVAQDLRGVPLTPAPDEDPLAFQLRVWSAQARELRLGADWLRHLWDQLYSELFQGAFILSGLRWRPTPVPVVQPITAETLPGWDVDLATDFARLIGTETYLYDLRVVPAAAKTEPTESPSPPAEAQRARAQGHPANAWLRREVSRRRNLGETVPADMATARDLCGAWEGAHPKQTPPRPRAVRELVRRALANTPHT